MEEADRIARELFKTLQEMRKAEEVSGVVVDNKEFGEILIHVKRAFLAGWKDRDGSD